jgi:hypothetical protein
VSTLTRLSLWRAVQCAVLAVGQDLQMYRVDTTLVPAAVVDVVSRGYRAIGRLVGQAMRLRCLAGDRVVDVPVTCG